MRLFETLAQNGAFWVFLAVGMLLGALESLLRGFRALFGDPLWLRVVLAPIVPFFWVVLTVLSVEYAYPYGFRAWQVILQAVGFWGTIGGPGAFVCDWGAKVHDFRVKLRKKRISDTIDERTS